MYAAVPMIIPACVARIVKVGELAGSPLACGGRLRHCGQSEVEHLDNPRRSDHDVGGFQIAMGDAFFVGSFESVRDLARVVEKRSR